MALQVKHILHHDSGRKSFRRAYAPDLQSIVGQTQHKVSLGHPDDPGFLTRYEQALAEWSANVARAKCIKAGQFDRLDPPRLAYLGKLFETQWLQTEETRRRSGEENFAHKTEAAWEWLLDDFRRWYAEGDVESAVEHWAQSAHMLLGVANLVIDPSDGDGFGQLCMELNEAAIRVSDVSLARLRGRIVTSPALPAPPPQEANAPALSLTASFGAHAGESGMSPAYRDEGRNQLAKFVEFVHHDDARRLTSEDVVAWMDHLLAEPSSDGGKRSPATVNKYLAAIKVALKRLVKRRQLKTNVAEGIAATQAKKTKSRESYFNKEEVRTILSATLKPAPDRMAETNRRARRWVPWLCAYTGARVNEMTQLRGIDVYEVDDIMVLRITPEAGRVKTGQYREVPMHEHLIAQGFLDVVREAGDGYVFYDPSRRRGKGDANRHAKKPGERLAAWVREDLGIDDPVIMPNHSWRHTFKTIAVGQEILASVSDAVTGHANPRNEVGRRYEAPTLKAKAAAMARFPRFDLD